MTAAPDKVRADFDRIAGILSERGERAELYECMLGAVPANCRTLLDVGSGAGRFARLAAGHAGHVTGIDISPRMTELARARSTGYHNLRFVCGDFMQHPFDDASFDCVLSRATMHHLQWGPAVTRMKDLLAPRGTLIVHDVRALTGWRDRVWSGARAVAAGEIGPWIRHRFQDHGELAHAWHDHGASESYLTMADVHALSEAHLPGARVVCHPLWRYSVVWQKDGTK